MVSALLFPHMWGENINEGKIVKTLLCTENTRGGCYERSDSRYNFCA